MNSDKPDMKTAVVARAATLSAALNRPVGTTEVLDDLGLDGPKRHRAAQALSKAVRRDTCGLKRVGSGRSLKVEVQKGLTPAQATLSDDAVAGMDATGQAVLAVNVLGAFGGAVTSDQVAAFIGGPAHDRSRTVALMNNANKRGAIKKVGRGRFAAHHTI